jgi:electron transfer flavoprotein beta subunit
MKIIVCIKQVPGTMQVKIDPVTHTLIREGGIINPFDTYALEEGVRIKEKLGGKVTVISMGPPLAIESLRETISLGADEAILLSDSAFAGADTLATSYTLANGIQKIGGVDIIICGKQAMDGDTAQVGPGIAENLNIPFVTWVRKIEEIREGYIRVQRLMEDSYEVIEMALPALITVVKEINIPRLPSLKAMLRAKNVSIPVWTANDLGVERNRIGMNGSPTKVVHTFTPPSRSKGEIFAGPAAKSAEVLVEKLRGIKIV